MTHPRHTTLIASIALACALLTGCGEDPPSDGPPPDATPDMSGAPDMTAPIDEADMDATPQPARSSGPLMQDFELLAPRAQLLRASMALRGTRPSMAEYERVDADPDAYAELVDEFLDSPEFGETVRQYVTEWLELDQAPDTYPAGFPSIGALSGLSSHELNTSIIQAPGRLAEHVMMRGRPWSEIVTAEYTLADHTVSVVWGLPYDDAKGGWQVTEYTDGRSAAGLLSDGWIFTRMPSTDGNRNRERASLIAGAFICHDYPSRPVKIPADLDLTSEAAISNAIEHNPACVSCHHTLDPLASFFAVHHGLRIPETDITSYPIAQYTPEKTIDFERPAWYGQPASDLAELGALIAEDPRFASCSIRRFYSELMHQPFDDVPFGAIARYLPEFKRSGLDARALVRAIALSPEFRARQIDPERGPRYVDVGLRRATPRQLDKMFDALIGYRWLANVDEVFGAEYNIGEVPLMRDFLWGYRTLAGGPNNFDTVEHTRTANPTTLLVLSNLAERAARHVVDNDVRSFAAPVLLTVEGAWSGDREAVEEQLELLAVRLYGLEEDQAAAEAARVVALFDAVVAAADVERAWEIVLTAMFQDPRVLFY